jgi:hypothetical protein
MEIQYSQLKINHLNDTPSTKAAGGRIFSGVFQQGRQGTNQGQEDFELSWYLFFQQGVGMSSSAMTQLIICVEHSLNCLRVRGRFCKGRTRW